MCFEGQTSHYTSLEWVIESLAESVRHLYLSQRGIVITTSLLVASPVFLPPNIFESLIHLVEVITNLGQDIFDYTIDLF